MVRSPLGALVFYKAKGDGLSEAGAKPGSHPVSRGVAAHTAGFLGSVTGAKQFTYIAVFF